MSKKDYKQSNQNKNKTVITKKGKSVSTKIFLYLAVILFITFSSYLSSLNNNFANWDDDPQIVNNADIKSLTAESITKLFTNLKGTVGMYQPLTSLSFAVEYKFFSLNPLPFHIDNLILHLLNVLLVFFFIYTLTRKINISAFVALFFGIHPMHVESVAWVTERKDVLYSFFFLAGLISYIYYTRRKEKISDTKDNTHNPVYLFLTFVFFLFSLLSKSAAVSFPLILILIDYYFLKKQEYKFNIKDIIIKIIFIIISGVFGIVTIYSQKSSGAIADLTPAYSIFERIFLACYATSSYIFKLFIPVGLCAMHYFPEKSSGLLPIEYYLSAIFIAGIISLMIFSKSNKYKKDVIFGFLFFIATIVMVLQILPVGFAITAERYTYIPYIGLLLPIGIIFNSILEDKSSKLNKYKPLLIIFLVFSFITFSVVTFARNKVWQNGIALFTDVIEKNPDKFHGYWIRGSAYSNKKNYKAAIEDFDKALEKKAPNPDEILNNRGNAKNNLNDYKGALIDLNQAIKSNPKLAEAYSNRGNARDNLGDFTGAMEDYDKALFLKPDMITAFNNRGVTKGKIAVQNSDPILRKLAMDKAIDDFNTAIRINPFDASAYLNRGNAKGFMKDYAGSIEDFSIAIKYGPEESQAYFNRGISKISLKDTIGACEDWKKSANLGNESAQGLVRKFCK